MDQVVEDILVEENSDATGLPSANVHGEWQEDTNEEKSKPEVQSK